ncbi:hypothetical protein JOF42_000773 [Microbacterium phyllosphaerae]|uniref:Swt1-like HEPN domain-containing protein n=1 Tax=Microbacterium phyllosphaerae TaxID=124798 RepID=A0ABS4WM43_9MICO|nr:hypothetical protein [Microbacterium phyllosphaerae]MBP2377278.1 hypothetical protein [Microbacterium phyllosphaerae]
MQSAAEISAQVFTARDAMLRDSLEDLRVAFLLFDSAIETLMVREIRHLSNYLLRAESPWRSNSDGRIPADLNDPEQRGEVETSSTGYVDWAFSKSQVRDIDRNFDDKLRFFAWHGDIPVEYVRIISRLHDYRNEMYHREESRPEALRVVCHLYAFFVADFLDRLEPHGFSWPGDAGAMERLYARLGEPYLEEETRRVGLVSNLQRKMAAALRRDLDLDDAPTLIAAYIANRVDQAHDFLRYSGEVAVSVFGGRFTEMDTIRFAFQPIPNTKAEHAKLPTRATLMRWDAWPEGTRQLSDPVEAFRSLAEFEAEFEEFEAIVLTLMTHAELEVDRQIDEEKERRLYEE